MMRRTLTIELQEDCVFSARAATEGGHESLDRIPGAALLGVAASKLYQSLDARQAWDAFHSGRLRFGDGMPLEGKSIAFPMPLAWHYAKNDEPAEHGRLSRYRIHNLACDFEEGRLQRKQLRKGYVCADGRWIKPRHALRLKTAIDPASGRAAAGQLFGYDALARGQRFVALIEADSAFDSRLFEAVIGALAGDVLLGRSRSAEYGRARIGPTEVEWPQCEEIRTTSLRLWLLSDLALVDSNGQPSLVPDGNSLGLPGTEIDWGKTFLRTRRYSPWNAKRRGYDRERLVLVAGGVICARVESAPAEHQIARLHAGIGLHREVGLGRLWVNPPLLADPHPRFCDSVPEQVSQAPVRPEHPLVDWLTEQAQTVDWKEQAEQKARKLADDYIKLVKNARSTAGVDPELDFGPSKAQWGRVLEEARNRSGQALFGALFEGDAAAVKGAAEGWKEEASEGQKWVTLAAWLQEKLAFADTDTAHAYAHRVRALAHRVRDAIDKRRV